MANKIVRVAGLLLIIGFSALSMFFSLIVREIEDPEIQQGMAYPSYFEDRFYDVRMMKTLDPQKVDKRIVLAKIDDDSIRKIGRFPWSREIWGKVNDKLKEFGAKVVSYDVFFPEPERACQGETPDEKMAKSIINFQSNNTNKIILGYSMNTMDAESYEEIPDSLYSFVLDTKQVEGNNLRAGKVSKAAFPIPLFANTEAGLGHVQTEDDLDGIFRHYQLMTNVDEIYFPSFALLTYMSFTGDKPVLDLTVAGSPRLNLKTGKINLNYKGETKVRWIGGMGNFPEVGIYDLLNTPSSDKKMRELLEGKIVYIGSTAFGAHDLRHTPVDPMLPGVYFHMNMTHMLLEGLFFKDTVDSTFYSWIMLILGSLIIIGIQYFGHPLIDVATLVFFVGSLTYIDTYYLLPAGYEIKLFFCIFSMVGCYGWNTILNFYFANKDKQFLKSAFGSYISPELIDEMYASGEPPKLGGESGVRTAYFTDIQSFSTFSEKLTATQLVELLNEYLTAMTDILLEKKGTLDKYEGDAIIAFFGAPMPLEDHAVKSFEVALGMQEKLLELRKKWVSEGDKWPDVVKDMRMRIGINSGEIVTGNMGSRDRMNYTMMGDSVNLAARLEEAAKQYGIFTQVSQFTADLTNDLFELRELDTIKVVGKSEPVTTYDLLGKKGETADYLVDLKNVFHEGLSLYKDQKWDEAIAKFKVSLELEHKRFPGLKNKKNPSLIYIERCEDFKKSPPGNDWDGVYTLTSK